MCVFCKIIAGEIPGKKVYEDDVCLAILDISQATLGHTLVMPKKHIANILECDDETLAHLICVTRKLAKQLCEKLGCEGCNILNNCNEVAGQSVMHLHFHILPRTANDDLTLQFKEHEVDLDALLEKIK